MRKKIEFRVTCEDGDIKLIKKTAERFKKEITNLKNEIAWNKDTPEAIWSDFVFCLINRQVSVEKVVDKAYDMLLKKGFDVLEEVVKPYAVRTIRKILQQAGHRYANKMATYIVDAAKWIQKYHGDMKQYLEFLVKEEKCDDYEIRDDLEAFDGVGSKIASLFMRNIKLSTNLAIVDRHFTRFLKDANFLHYDSDKFNLTANRYREIEICLQNISEKVGIEPGYLDIAIFGEQSSYFDEYDDEDHDFDEGWNEAIEHVIELIDQCKTTSEIKEMLEKEIAEYKSKDLMLKTNM